MARRDERIPETGIGAKTVAQSQEIPNWAELVLPIS